MKKISYLTILLVAMISAASCNKDDDDVAGRTSGPTEDGTSSEGEGSTDGDNVGTGGEAGVITAGEWNDLTNWDFFLDIMQNDDYADAFPYWDFNLNERYSLLLTDQNSNPVVDAKVNLLDSNSDVMWRAKTDNSGMAELWANLYERTSEAAKIVVEYNSETYTFDEIHSYSGGWMAFTIPVVASVPQNVNVMFVVDATGSMGDEIDFLKSDLMSVMESVKQEQSNKTVSLSAVFYRDYGDDYLVREFGFTTDINSIISSVNNQNADGGGDFPEAVDDALKTAMQQQWSSSAVSRIMFFLLDAPPHYEPAVLIKMQNAIQKAAEKGVKIIPVSASGIDKKTEMLLRCMAIATNGTYTFITDDSGVGGSHLEPTVGEYQVEKLNELIIRLINKYSKVE